jgi:transcriptional antiterminator
MTFITLTQLSGFVELSERTIKTRIAELKASNKFQKEYPGRNYTVKEAQKILDLLNIPVKLDNVIEGKKRK